ncbi:16703_t:CDS:1, partial [Dentiscutata erythropus]
MNQINDFVINQTNDFVTHIQNPTNFQRIFQVNIHSHIQISRRTNTRKRITAYDIFKKRISEEGFLINVTNSKVIGLSANRIWINLTSAEKNLFRNFAIQIHDII